MKLKCIFKLYLEIVSYKMRFLNNTTTQKPFEQKIQNISEIEIKKIEFK